jgi:ligand-binding sensor domain-containing protein
MPRRQKLSRAVSQCRALATETWKRIAAHHIIALTEVHLSSNSRLIQHFTRKDGLSDNRIVAALEDREGNIWVATRGGLDRFRTRNVVPSTLPYGSEEQDLALVADKDGAIWAGDLDQPLMRLRNNKVFFRAGAQSVTCAYRDSDGALWFGGEGILTRFAGERLETVALPGAIRPSLHWPVQAITSHQAGDL